MLHSLREDPDCAWMRIHPRRKHRQQVRETLGNPRRGRHLLLLHQGSVQRGQLACWPVDDAAPHCGRRLGAPAELEAHNTIPELVNWARISVSLRSTVLIVFEFVFNGFSIQFCSWCSFSCIIYFNISFNVFVSVNWIRIIRKLTYLMRSHALYKSNRIKSKKVTHTLLGAVIK